MAQTKIRVQQTKNDIKFRAYLNADQNDITDNTWTVVHLDTEHYDTSGNFNTSTYQFIPPVDGYYHFDYSVQIKNLIANKRYIALLKVDNTTYYGGSTANVGSDTGFTRIAGSDTIYLTTSNYLELGVLFACGANTVDIDADTGTFLSGYLLST